MECKFSGWAQFWGDGANFSPTFREQMSEQLYLKFYEMLGIKDESKKKFGLRVGLEDMKTVVENGFAFGLVTIISPTAFSKTITAYWKKSRNEDPRDAIFDNSLTASTIEFGFCSDFEEDFFLQFLKPKQLLSKEKNNLNFTVEYDYTTYPDLSITIYTKNLLGEDNLKAIHSILNRNIANTYISEIISEGDECYGIFDFHDTPYEKGITELLVAFQELSKSEISSKIEKILIE